MLSGRYKVILPQLEQLIPERQYLKYRENGDFLIVSSYTLDIYYLNAVAKDFYLAIGPGKSIATLRDELLKEYDVDKETLSTDIARLVRELQWKNILVLREKHEEL